MKEIIIRIYDGDDQAVIDAAYNRDKINFFDLFIDGETYSNMKHLVLDVRAPKKDEHGALFVDKTEVIMTMEKNY